MVFKHLPFDECQRLGLSEQAERDARAAPPEGTNGLLVVEQLIRGSALEGKLCIYMPAIDRSLSDCRLRFGGQASAG